MRGLLRWEFIFAKNVNIINNNLKFLYEYILISIIVKQNKHIEATDWEKAFHSFC